jgi:hypothetical protein
VVSVTDPYVRILDFLHSRLAETLCKSLKCNIVAYLLKVGTVELEKQTLLGDGCVTCNNGVIIASGLFCAVPAECQLPYDQWIWVWIRPF